MKVKFAISFLFIFYQVPVFAYPHSIGFGYSSCSSCHFNPLGNGPLTDYGRALAATEIAANFFQKDASEESLAQNSRFLGPFGELPEWIRLAADYRGMYLAQNLQTSPTTRWIHMQAEGSLTLKGMEDRLIATGTIGYAPVPQHVPTSRQNSTSTLVTREHYIGFRLSDQLAVYAGLMDHAFGIRVPDHMAYLREKTLTGINDQTHGILLHGIWDKGEGALHLVLGNLFQESSLRQRGGTAVFEYEIAENLRVGPSLLFTASEFRSRQMVALHSRIGVLKGHSLLAEAGLAREQPKSKQSRLENFLFLQTSTRLARGFYLLMTFEHFSDDFLVSGARYYRMGPSLQFIPGQRVEFRSDFLATRTRGLVRVNPDSLAFMTQLHVWL